MEREIKFRVWDVEKKKFIIGLTYRIECVSALKKDWHIISQYTGLKDKNGKEIYEGDIDKCGYIIKYCNIKGLFAQFGKKWGGVDGNIDDYDRIMTYPIQAQEIEIIGNIYENPELLK